MRKPVRKRKREGRLWKKETQCKSKRVRHRSGNHMLGEGTGVCSLRKLKGILRLERFKKNGGGEEKISREFEGLGEKKDVGGKYWSRTPRGSKLSLGIRWVQEGKEQNGRVEKEFQKRAWRLHPEKRSIIYEGTPFGRTLPMMPRWGAKGGESAGKAWILSVSSAKLKSGGGERVNQRVFGNWLGGPGL